MVSERDSNPMTMNSLNQTPCSPVNNNQAVDVSEWEVVESTKEEEVDVLLNDKFKGKKFDSKGKHEWMREYIKQLKVCIKWFQKNLEDLVKEKDHLHKMLDSSERKCVEAEDAMKLKEEELNSTISKLENNISSLKESLANEESQKLNAIGFHNKEKEAMMALEKNQNSLKEDLLQAKQNALTANEEVKTQQDMNKILQEYNTSLQQYNTKLQNQLFTAIDANKHVEKEKAAILENHITLKGHYSFLQQEFTSVNKCCAQTEKISMLEHQLAVANEKLKMVDLSSLEIRRKYEDQKRLISKLEDQLLEAGQLFEGERLRAQRLYKLM